MSDLDRFMAAPPLGDLIDFDVFASAMCTAPLEDLHRYLDSDEEQDLEDNYAGDDSDKENEIIDQEGGLNHDVDHNKYQPYVELDDVNDGDEYANGDAEGDVNDHGQSQKYEYFDPRLDIDLSKLRPSHAASRHLNPKLQKMIDKTELMLEQLSIQAQTVLEEQPMSTQIILANQALDQVFTPYGMHGSQAQFSASVLKFLGGGETVRRPGHEGRNQRNDGKLRFAEVDPAAEPSKDGIKRRKKLKRRATEDEKRFRNLGEGNFKIKLQKGNTGDDISAAGKMCTKNNVREEELEMDNPNVSGERVGYQLQPASTIPLEGSRVIVDSLSFRKTSGPLDLDLIEKANNATSISAKPNLYLDDFQTLKLEPRAPAAPLSDGQCHSTSTATTSRSPFTPLATTFSQSLCLQTPIAPVSSISPPYHPSPQPQLQPHTYSCIHDPKSNAALALEAYSPISLKLTWPATTRSDGRPCMPTPGLLDALNNILHLTNAEARFMLSYYVRKYEAPLYLHGSGGEGEAPHALFRLGVAQYLMSRVGKVIDNKESDELGLNPEARRVLGEVWERHPSTGAWFDEGILREGGATEPDGYGGGYDAMYTGRDSEGDDLTSQTEHRGIDDSHPPSESESTADTTTSPVHSPQPRSSLYPKPKDVIGGLNPLEKSLLARACNISVETVEAYWDDMRWKTRGWGAMKAWCTAKDKVRIAKAKAEGRW